MAKVFLTGASGFIGGEALHELATSRPELKISCLNRDPAKTRILQQAYPNIRVVEGDLDSADVLERESKDADIVFHLASTSHKPSADAILRGLSDKSRPNTGYWIQISGASAVAADEIKQGRYGEASDESYDDIRDIDKVRSLITANPARAVDNLIIAQDASSVRTALIVGPWIHGTGNGPINKRSIQAPEIARVTLERKKGIRLGKGLNVWSTIHIHDLGHLFVALLDAAVAKDVKVWNENGVYLPENGKLAFGDMYSAVATESKKQNLIDTEDLDEITAAEANSLTSHGAVIWGTNAIISSSRAQLQLKWNPSGSRLLDEVPDLVRFEAKRLGIRQ